MAKNINSTEKNLARVEETLSRTERYIEENRKSLTLIVSVIVGIIAIYLAFTNFYLKPLEKEATNDMFMAQIYFEKDSFNLALNGDGQYLGFLDIINEYGLTKSGKLANYYSGLCYLYTKRYEEAIEYLSDFSSDDIILSTLALGCIGDAYLETDNLDDALDYYEEATNNTDNNFTTPKYLMKQALVLETKNEHDKALKIYQRIKLDYQKSKEAVDIEKYIVRAANN